MVASCAPPTGDLAHNPGMCPEWESNQLPFGLQATEPHKPGLHLLFANIIITLEFVLVSYFMCGCQAEVPVSSALL